ncbi:MAG: Uma2 family endonuclease [Thermodesulfovibrionales bacterium]|nr:Uma2 family endonuclease [Thermodesulfovibrionales bacterium]
MPLIKEKRLSVNYYKLLPEGAPYQLIEGELVMTPAPNPRHQIVLGNIVERIRNSTQGKGIVISSPVDVYLDDENAFQPDIIFITREKKDIIKKDGIYGAPDLVIEILSPFTAFRDIREKFRVYERAGVKEYWIVDPEINSVEIYFNEVGSFSLIIKAEGKGTVESQLLKDLKIELEAIFKDPLGD